MQDLYNPPAGIRNPHVQTMLSSVVRKQLLKHQHSKFLTATQSEMIQVNGVQLKVERTTHPDAPTIVIIPGWLGSASSSYVLSAAAHLWQAGFSVARLNLRDHGGTAHINEGLFHSALIDEVFSAVKSLAKPHPEQSGLLGFSLGGNFALRAARALTELPTLAVAPVIKPGETMVSIDQNFIYQRYFINKWRRVWQEKQQAFPHRYDFRAALNISTVSALTDYFVSYHTDFTSTAAYFDAYDLSADTLAGVSAKVVVAADDPIIPLAHFADLPESLDIETTQYGGHTAYLKNWQFESWLDDYACKFFTERLTLDS